MSLSSGKTPSFFSKTIPSFAASRSRALLRDAAKEGMVLLKNDGVLPLDKDIKSLGIIGPNAKKSQIIGGGSAHLKAYYESHPLDAFEENLGAPRFSSNASRG